MLLNSITFSEIRLKRENIKPPVRKYKVINYIISLSYQTLTARVWWSSSCPWSCRWPCRRRWRPRCRPARRWGRGSLPSAQSDTRPHTQSWSGSSPSSRTSCSRLPDEFMINHLSFNDLDIRFTWGIDQTRASSHDEGFWISSSVPLTKSSLSSLELGLGGLGGLLGK